MLKKILMVFGILLFLSGVIWFLQGISVLPGSYMSGNPQWAINGSITMLIGAIIFWLGKRNPRS